MRPKTIFTPRKIGLWICIFIFIIGFGRLQQPAQSEVNAHITTMAAEIMEDEYVVSVKVLTPTQAITRSDKVYTAKGKTLSQTMQQLTLQIGKRLGFCHCDVVLVGENLCKSGIVEILDYLTRLRRIGRNALVVNFEGHPDECMRAITHMNDNLSLDFSSLLQETESRLFTSDTSIEKFYQDYYSNASSSYMPKVILTNEEFSGIQVQSGGDSQGGSGGGGDSQGSSGGNTNLKSGTESAKYFRHDGTASLFKEGKKIGEIPFEESKKFNYFGGKNQRCILELHNVNDNLYTNAEIVVRSRNKSAKLKSYFEDDVPHLNVSVNLEVVLQQIYQETKNEEFLTGHQNFFTPEVKRRIIELVTLNMYESLDFMAANNLDIIGVYDKFDKFNYKKWKSYYENLPEPKNYMSELVMEVEIKCNVVA